MRFECKDTGEVVEAEIDEATVSRDADDNVHVSIIRDGKRYELTVPLAELLEGMEKIDRGDNTPLKSKGRLDVDRIQ